MYIEKKISKLIMFVLGKYAGSALTKSGCISTGDP